MKIRPRHLMIALIGIVAYLVTFQSDFLEQVMSPAVSYERDVFPVLEKHCIGCHAAGKPGAEATGLLLDSHAAIMRGSEYGPVIDPGSARTSSLYILLTGQDNLTVTMPHGGQPLADGEIDTIRAWIDNGAPE